MTSSDMQDTRPRGIAIAKPRPAERSRRPRPGHGEVSPFIGTPLDAPAPRARQTPRSTHGDTVIKAQRPAMTRLNVNDTRCSHQRISASAHQRSDAPAAETAAKVISGTVRQSRCGQWVLHGEQAVRPGCVRAQAFRALARVFGSR
jgi:hypothetical protein